MLAGRRLTSSRRRSRCTTRRTRLADELDVGRRLVHSAKGRRQGRVALYDRRRDSGPVLGGRPKRSTGGGARPARRSGGGARAVAARAQPAAHASSTWSPSSDCSTRTVSTPSLRWSTHVPTKRRCGCGSATVTTSRSRSTRSPLDRCPTTAAPSPWPGPPTLGRPRHTTGERSRSTTTAVRRAARLHHLRHHRRPRCAAPPTSTVLAIAERFGYVRQTNLGRHVRRALGAELERPRLPLDRPGAAHRQPVPRARCRASSCCTAW